VHPREWSAAQASRARACSPVSPRVVEASEGWRDLVEYRDVVLQKDYFQEYLRISEDFYARPRFVTLLEPFPAP
jgi:hypothetical protein